MTSEYVMIEEPNNPESMDVVECANGLYEALRRKPHFTPMRSFLIAEGFNVLNVYSVATSPYLTRARLRNQDTQ